MEEKIIEVLDHYWFSRIGKKEAVERLLNLHIVMLSETLDEAEKIATEIDNGKSEHSLGESQGFESGAEWVIGRIKEKLHSA